MANVLIAGCDATVSFDEEATTVDVTATLNGTTVTLSNDPSPVDASNLSAGYTLDLLSDEVLTPGDFVLTWVWDDADGIEHTRPVTYIVLASDNPDALLTYRVNRFLRLEDDDPTVLPLVLAAKQYLDGAGITDPRDDSAPQDAAVAQYELAVCLYVSIVYSGGESKLDPAMTSVILQMRS